MGKKTNKPSSGESNTNICLKFCVDGAHLFVVGEWSWNIPYMTRVSKSKLRDISLYEKHVSDPWCKMLKNLRDAYFKSRILKRTTIKVAIWSIHRPPPRALPIWDMKYKKGHLLLNLLFDLMSLASSASCSIVQINSFLTRVFRVQAAVSKNNLSQKRWRGDHCKSRT